MCGAPALAGRSRILSGRPRRGAGDQEPRRAADPRREAIKSRVRLALTGRRSRTGSRSLVDLRFACPGSSARRPSSPLRQALPSARRRLRSAPQPRAPLSAAAPQERQGVIADLPDKTEVKPGAPDPPAAALYQEGVRRSRIGWAVSPHRGRGSCCLPHALQADLQPSSQWLGDGEFRRRRAANTPGSSNWPRRSPRARRSSSSSPSSRRCRPLAELLADPFGRPGVVSMAAPRRSSARPWSTPSRATEAALLRPLGQGRRHRAQSHRGIPCRAFRQMVESGGGEPGDGPRLPHRQKKNVLVHKFICRGTVEEKIDALIEAKLGLSGEIVEGGGAVC